MNLFDEFISALYATDNKCTVLSQEESRQVFDAFTNNYPIKWGRVDWSKVKHKENIQKLTDIAFMLEKHGKDFNAPIYIIWGNAKLPFVMCTITDVLSNIEAAKFLGVTSTVLFSITQGFVIEFYHDGDMTLGFTEETGESTK